MKNLKSLATGLKHTITTRKLEGDVIENYSMQLKSTTTKDARKTAEISILCNHMLKRNESGVWQKRFVCIVPHMYLYYFDSDQSEFPRGIIDLEYFTDCSADEEGVLTMQPTAGIPLRSFFFQIDDPTVRSDWLSTLMSERYQTIREERDAYKQMQTHFSSEMNSVTAIMHTSSQDNVKIQADLDAALLNVEETFQMIKRLLAVVEVGDDDLIDPAACDAIGPASEALEKRVNDMRAKLEIEKIKEIEAAKKECGVLQCTIDELKVEMSTQKKKQEELDLQRCQDKESADAKIIDLQKKLHYLNKTVEELKFENKVSEEKALSEIVTLNEQKKALIKEVKQCRKKIESMTETLGALTTEKDLRTERLLEVEAKCEDLSKIAKEQDFAHAQNILALQDMYEAKLSALKSKYEADLASAKASAAVDDAATRSISPVPEVGESSTSQEVLAAAVIAAAKDLLSPSLPPQQPQTAPMSVGPEAIPTKDFDGNLDKLSSLDWLTDEQRAKIASREALEKASDAEKPKSSAPMRGLFGSLSIPNIMPAMSSSTSTTTAALRETEDGLVTISATSPASTMPSIASPTASSAMASGGSSGQSTSSFVPTCLRCNGTVEGPKYSTCKCKVPALTPEDLLEKKSILGGIMGAFRRPSMNPVKEVSSANTTPKGSISETVPETKVSPTTDLYSTFPVSQEELAEEVLTFTPPVDSVDSQKKPTPVLLLDLDG